MENEWVTWSEVEDWINTNEFSYGTTEFGVRQAGIEVWGWM